MIIDFLLITDQHAEAPHRQWNMPMPPRVGEVVQFDPGEDAPEFKVVAVRYYALIMVNNEPANVGAECVVEPIVPTGAPPKETKKLF